MKSDPQPKLQQSDANAQSFLYHVYPDGVGPDAELISMLERDSVDKNPNVNFDDIAGLTECKRMLEEAVLLPIMMP